MTSAELACWRLLEFLVDNPGFKLREELLLFVRPPGRSDYTDTVSVEKRSEIMSKIRGKGTKPELAVKAFLEEAGASFMYQPKIAGHPDFLVAGRTAVFVNGCFWHGCPEHYKEPKSNVEFWRAKVRRNAERQDEAITELRALGYRVFVLWEHSVRDGSFEKDLQQAVEG